MEKRVGSTDGACRVLVGCAFKQKKGPKRRVLNFFLKKTAQTRIAYRPLDQMNPTTQVARGAAKTVHFK